jgi:threonine dehydrogenase-like Zn-dependent dehydrogenase
MKALVIKDGHLELQERPRRSPGWGEALVRVRAVGICATDLHLLDGTQKFERSPQVLGHEIAGVVESVGGGGFSSDWKGSRVIVDPVVGCGVCPYCHAGRKLLCKAGGELGTTWGDGGYAEYVIVPATNLHRWPVALSFEEGAVIEPLNCTWGAFLRAQAQPGESVLIFGSGPAGLLFLSLARAAGCAPVYMIGRGAVRLNLARQFGAAQTWLYRDTDLQEKVLQATEGRGPDIVVEASGADVAVHRAFEWVRPGGRVVLYGVSGTGRANIASDRIVQKDLQVVTGIGAPLLWDRAVQLAAGGRIDLRSLVTHRFPLEKADEALSIARDGDRAIKVVLCP